MVTSDVKKLPLARVLGDSLEYFAKNMKSMLLFSAVNYVVLLAGFYLWKTVAFFPLLIVAYIFWSVFFRWYFERKPYFDGGIIWQSTVPSTKIIVLSLLFVSVIILLPLVPLFLGLPAEMQYKYSAFLQKYMHESDVLDMGLNLVVTLVSPYVIYRPFMAWIASLQGRSGVLHSAWKKTVGNYIPFLMMALVFNLAFILIQQVSMLLHFPEFVMLFLLSPLLIYFNIVQAKTYEFFFVEL